MTGKFDGLGDDLAKNSVWANQQPVDKSSVESKKAAPPPDKATGISPEKIITGLSDAAAAVKQGASHVVQQLSSGIKASNASIRQQMETLQAKIDALKGECRDAKIFEKEGPIEEELDDEKLTKAEKDLMDKFKAGEVGEQDTTTDRDVMKDKRKSKLLELVSIRREWKAAAKEFFNSIPVSAEKAAQQFVSFLEKTKTKIVDFVNEHPLFNQPKEIAHHGEVVLSAEHSTMALSKQLEELKGELLGLINSRSILAPEKKEHLRECLNVLLTMGAENPHHLSEIVDLAKSLKASYQLNKNFTDGKIGEFEGKLSELQEKIAQERNTLVGSLENLVSELRTANLQGDKIVLENDSFKREEHKPGISASQKGTSDSSRAAVSQMLSLANRVLQDRDSSRSVTVLNLILNLQTTILENESCIAVLKKDESLLKKFNDLEFSQLQNQALLGSISQKNKDRELIGLLTSPDKHIRGTEQKNFLHAYRAVLKKDDETASFISFITDHFDDCSLHEQSQLLHLLDQWLKDPAINRGEHLDPNNRKELDKLLDKASVSPFLAKQIAGLVLDQPISPAGKSPEDGKQSLDETLNKIATSPDIKYGSKEYKQMVKELADDIKNMNLENYKSIDFSASKRGLKKIGQSGDIIYKYLGDKIKAAKKADSVKPQENLVAFYLAVQSELINKESDLIDVQGFCGIGRMLSELHFAPKKLTDEEQEQLNLSDKLNREPDQFKEFMRQHAPRKAKIPPLNALMADFEKVDKQDSSKLNQLNPTKMNQLGKLIQEQQKIQQQMLPPSYNFNVKAVLSEQAPKVTVANKEIVPKEKQTLEQRAESASGSLRKLTESLAGARDSPIKANILNNIKDLSSKLGEIVSVEEGADKTQLMAKMELIDRVLDSSERLLKLSLLLNDAKIDDPVNKQNRKNLETLSKALLGVVDTKNVPDPVKVGRAKAKLIEEILLFTSRSVKLSQSVDDAKLADAETDSLKNNFLSISKELYETLIKPKKVAEHKASMDLARGFLDGAERVLLEKQDAASAVLQAAFKAIDDKAKYQVALKSFEEKRKKVSEACQGDKKVGFDKKGALVVKERTGGLKEQEGKSVSGRDALLSVLREATTVATAAMKDGVADQALLTSIDTLLKDLNKSEWTWPSSVQENFPIVKQTKEVLQNFRTDIEKEINSPKAKDKALEQGQSMQDVQDLFDRFTSPESLQRQSFQDTVLYSYRMHFEGVRKEQDVPSGVQIPNQSRDFLKYLIKGDGKTSFGFDKAPLYQQREILKIVSSWLSKEDVNNGDWSDPAVREQLDEVMRMAGETGSPALITLQIEINDKLQALDKKAKSEEVVPSPTLKDGAGNLEEQLSKVANGTMKEKEYGEFVRQFADDLTLLMKTDFDSINLNEFYTKGQPSFAQFENHFNQISNFMYKQIFDLKKPEERANMIKFFTRVANQCVDPNRPCIDFVTNNAIASVLNITPITRLKKTMAMLDEKDLESLSILGSSAVHAKEALKEAQASIGDQQVVMPFLRNSHTMFFSGMEDYRGNKYAPKLRTFGNYFEEMLTFQKKSRERSNKQELQLHFPINSSVVGSKSSIFVEMDEIYMKSYACEPKEGQQSTESKRATVSESRASKSSQSKTGERATTS